VLLRVLLRVLLQELLQELLRVPTAVRECCFPLSIRQMLLQLLHICGDYNLCSSYEQEIMNLTAPCEASPCHIDGVYQPNVTGDFYAMSGFYYTAHFFKIDSETNKTSAKEFSLHAQDFCSRTWANVTQEYDIDKDLLKVYCLTGSYIYNLLTVGFGFDEEKTDIYFTSEIKGTALNWALGGLIAEASLLPK